MNLAELLKDEECYDYSTLAVCQACLRKGFYSKILEGGLEAGVGPGADFGTCMHGAIATYYAWWGHRTESERRALGLRAFASLHETLFTGAIRDTLTTKHTIEQGLISFDHYCDAYLAEDHSLQPLEVELAGAVKISPQPNDPSFFTKPFWYTFRIDGIHRRLNYGDHWVRETKTTSGGVDREVLKQCLSRQPRGYLYCAREFAEPGFMFAGVMPDVIGVMARTLECRRTFYAKPLADSISWRAQTIQIVSDWRRKLQAAEANPSAALEIFYQNTGECTNYGQCAFFDLCRDGVTPQTLSKYRANTWNPLNLVEVPMPDVEHQTIQTPSGIKESIKV